MNISKIKLINGGLSGVEIEAVVPARHGNVTILDNAKLTRKFPLPDEFRNKIQGLKYFFLNLTGHWIEPYNKNFDLSEYKIKFPTPEEEPTKSFLLLQSVMNHTIITGISVKSSGFTLQGTIETVEGKKMNLVTPFVTEEDDVSFFTEAMDKIGSIYDDIAGFMERPTALPFNAKEALEASGVNTSDMGTLSADEMVNMVMQKFADSGAIVLMNEDMQEKPKELGEEAGKKPDSVKVHTKTGSIDGRNIPEAENHDDSQENKEEPPVKTVKKSAGSTLAADSNFPDLDTGKIGSKADNPASDLEAMEYSHNMGIPAETGGIEDESSDKPKTEW
jgi:hypothetical protein